MASEPEDGREKGCRCGFIALAGRPNAGKSTFLNTVLGEKLSIVSDKPQTTRNRILGVYHGEGLQIGFLDLPGIHKPKFRMNRQMMRAVHQGLDDADLAFHFVDISVKSGSGDRFVRDFLAEKKLPVILVVNKMDLVNKNRAVALVDELYRDFQPLELVPISAKTGANTDRLMEIAATLLPKGELLFAEDTLTDQPVRFMAAEFIRETILVRTRDELPHAVAVSIESFAFDEAEDRYSLEALIWVEKTTQRKIILGARGDMIKKIRESSRRSLKALLGKPVSLELFVKVQDKWRDQEKFLKNLDPLAD